MNFDDLLTQTLQLIRNSDVPLSREAITAKITCDEDELLINVFEYLEDERLAEYFLRGYVITPFGRDYLRAAKPLDVKQARLEFLEDLL